MWTSCLSSINQTWIRRWTDFTSQLHHLERTRDCEHCPKSSPLWRGTQRTPPPPLPPPQPGRPQQALLESSGWGRSTSWSEGKTHWPRERLCLRMKTLETFYGWIFHFLYVIWFYSPSPSRITPAELRPSSTEPYWTLGINCFWGV